MQELKKAYVFGVPHTQASLRFTTCAYTVKAINLCKMLKMIDWHVTFIGTSGSEAIIGVADEIVDVVSKEDFESYCGHPGTAFYDIRIEGPRKAYHEKWDANARAFLEDTACKNTSWKEIICCPWGWGNFEACKNVKNQYIVESGIGYDCTFANHRVFESYAWLHFHMGKENRSHGNCWKECVIPNSFDLKMFHSNLETRGRDYLLYFGRLIDSKGVRLAIEIAKACGMRILIIGQGDPAPYLSMYDKAEYHGPVGVEARNAFMSNAIALICPTYYVEPFGGVAVEAQLCGTPVISTDWGAFTETVVHGITGYRCRTFDQFIRAVETIHEIDPGKCRKWAENYSLEKIAPMYDEFFESVLDYDRYGCPYEGAKSLGGFYQRHPERKNLDFMRKEIL